MTQINKNGYVERRTCGKGKMGTRSNDINIIYRDWYLVRYSSKNFGRVDLGVVILPKRFIGKKVKFQMKVIK